MRSEEFMRRPIKHILDDTVVDEAGNAVRTIHLAQGVINADPYNAAQSQVNGGSAVVKHMNLMFECYINNKVNVSTLLYDRFDFYIWFNVAGAQSAPDPRTAGQNDLKNQIFHMDQSILGASTVAVTNAIGNISGRSTWNIKIKIPTWAQKINKDDCIDFVYVFSDAAAVHVLKLKCIFMEYEQA